MTRTSESMYCQMCGTERQANYALKTGVSAYAVCRECALRWLSEARLPGESFGQHLDRLFPRRAEFLAQDFAR